MVQNSEQDFYKIPLKDKLEHLPSEPGVYRFLNREGTVIYVGKAQNLRSRVRQYFHRSRTADPRISSMVQKIYDLEITVTKTVVEALILEANLIKELKPRYNVVLKDDKSYPYIVITDEEYPRVFVTRRRVHGKAQYFGPYTDVRTMRSALKTVRTIFMIRSCNYDLTETSIAQHKFKLCLDYHIKKCGGPCEGLVPKAEYQAMIRQVANVLRGKTRPVQKYLENEMERLSANMQFEDAAYYRDKIQQLKVYEEKQQMIDPRQRDRDIFGLVVSGNDGCCVLFRAREGKIVGNQHFYLTHAQEQSKDELLENVIEHYYLDTDDFPDFILLPFDIPSKEVIEEWLESNSSHAISLLLPSSEDDRRLIDLVTMNAQYRLDELLLLREQREGTIPESLKALQHDLQLPVLPRRIDCFDVSTLQGSDSVASMVVFIDGKPKKSEYRKFQIKTVEGQDDFASMREIIERRYSKITDETKPDLIVIDGGRGQLSSAQEILRSLNLDIPILGLAKRLEEIYLPDQSEPLLLPKTSSSLRLLQRIRDEAHRFAVQYHRTVRSKRILKTELELIEGVGKKRATQLLETFGSVERIRAASVEQLSNVVGKTVASRIHDYFSSKAEASNTSPSIK
ncbi:MAG: excinuclease ABC subunit C [Bacteroidetes bacterium]|nr:excinuclease ABC subunit C [Bacteroidota bacterium]